MSEHNDLLRQPAEVGETLIEMRDIVKTFKNAAGEFTVLKGVDLTIRRGEFVSIIGKSGSGKSTLLNMLTGIDHPTSGKVIVDGVDVYAMNESQRSLWRGRNLGIVFQFFQLLPMLSLLENVMLPMDYVGMYDFNQRPERALELLRMVGLEQHAHKLPQAVSTGQQQSTAIARALATDAPIIVADEPTGNLDTRASDKIIDLFSELSRRGKTIVMVTHDPMMTRRTSRTVILTDGEIVNEAVAQALPLLPHPLMRAVEQRARRQTYQPGEVILQAQAPVEHFFIILDGAVEVVHKSRRAKSWVASRLGRGDFFGEIELVSGRKAVASVRATEDGPVEVLILPREDFRWLMERSALTQEAIARIVQQRLAESRSGSRKRARGLFGLLGD